MLKCDIIHFNIVYKGFSVHNSTAKQTEMGGNGQKKKEKNWLKTFSTVLVNLSVNHFGFLTDVFDDWHNQ